MQYIKEE